MRSVPGFYPTINIPYHKWLHLPRNTSLVLLLILTLPAGLAAAPDECLIFNGIGTCQGDQSAGVYYNIPSPPISTLNINSLISAIEPAAGTLGIELLNVSGNNTVINSGSANKTISIVTTGADAVGTIGVSKGTPGGNFVDDSFLGVPLVGADPAVPGGYVEITSHSDITTDGNKSPGIYAHSASDGYPATVISRLESFVEENNYLFEITNVLDTAGLPAAWDPDDSSVPVQVRGYLIDEDGHPLLDGEGNRVEHGLFTISKDGTYSVTFTAEEKAEQNALNLGKAITVAVRYEVGMTRIQNNEERTDEGLLLVIFEHVESEEDGGDSFIREAEGVYFVNYGVSNKPAQETTPTIFPDLNQYVSDLLTAATAGSSGGSVTVNSNGTIATHGEESHGIHAYSIGGQGAPGENSTFYLFWESSPTAGGDGKSPGPAAVTANGTLTTDKNNSSGIVVISAGGAGGAGGSGVGYRDGRQGGTGGDGGLAEVYGSATIETAGDFSSGIVAFSNGGDGGSGGSTGGAMDGGKGGFGGKGGEVIVDGNWNVTTAGDKAHGIWAKSLGGNAGNGGSGGWLFGDPGWGGQATDGGSVTLSSGGEIWTEGDNSYGLYAQSVGGFGGSGGSSWGIFYSYGGDGNSGGSGGEVKLSNAGSGKVTTTGNHSHAILAQSIGGGGGSGGGAGAIVSIGGTGAAGGFGGSVEIENSGWLETSGEGAYGILAQSIGGGGGDGGSSGGLVAIGGSGSKTSDGGDVAVLNRGTIITDGELSHGIFAESIGGGGGSGGRSGGLFSIGGSGGCGGSAGIVTVVNEGSILTQKNESYGIFAQSIGGGGGSGGGAISVGAGVTVSIGGKGAKGGDGKAVEVTNREDSSVTTEGNRSYGIFAQSVGGGGGDGGFAISGSGGGFSVAVGGGGGAGGNAGTVDVVMSGSISTQGEEAYGIFAQSVGGGGGSGGFGIVGSYGGSGIGVNLGLGGSGGVGGTSETVTVDIDGTINTSGLRAHGIMAQSVGGGGGNGGFAIAGSIGGGTSVNLAFGGEGGSGNTGGDVQINGNAIITTESNEAHGMFAQSVGGSGGGGGLGVSASLGGGTSLNLAFGGEGGDGSSAGNVWIGSEATPLDGTITTYGDRAYGILAQSVGGGGGMGGAALSGALLGPAAITMGFGGDGGTGGLGGEVVAHNAADITTFGQQSYGILAQSVGGGGGAGGLSITGAVTAFGGLSLAMGGTGGEGNTGGDVTLFNSGAIQTHDEYSYGIFAQSIGGKGGAGGSSGSVMANFSSFIEIPPPYPSGSVNIAISLGGDGGTGGRAGAVMVVNSGAVITQGHHAYGILAQSVGGGGGDGGKGVAVTANISKPGIPEMPDEQIDVQVDFAMAIGGDGGSGNHGGSVDVDNHDVIDTSGISAHGIFAQSVGGGGGSGGDARSMILSIDLNNWSEYDPPPDPTSISAGATLSIGGKGGAAGDSGTVNVTNEGMIVTRGADAFGILAQSVGGGGGVGGSGYHGLDWQDFGVSEENEQFLDILPVQDEGDLHITLGGYGAGGGDGDAVTVSNIGSILTLGDGSLGILAQSIGGGGGLGGVGAVGGDGSIGLGGGGGVAGDGGVVNIDLLGSILTRGVAAHGIFAQSVGGGGGYAGNIDRGIKDFGINFAIGRDGGNAGDGGDIYIHSEGDITTLGDAAVGIYAQSVGGGGGLGGNIGYGFGFAGTAGGDGDGGRVELDHTGNITTYGDYAHGIVAQSVGGADYGGDVGVRINGDITVRGEGALAVIAQSEGTSGRKNIDIIYEGGTITGNNDSAVRFFEGMHNTFTNQGVVTTHGGTAGTAILASSGNDHIHNHGTITGAVQLGDGSNSFTNHAASFFNAGTAINLGTGNTLSNSGTLSPGGGGHIEHSSLTGHLIQTEEGLLAIDVDVLHRQADYLAVSGTAEISGLIGVDSVNKGYSQPGKFNIPIVMADNGLTTTELSLVQRQSAVANFSLDVTPGSSLHLNYEVNFTHPELNRNQTVIGEHINAIQSTGGSAAFAPLAAALFDVADGAALGAAYNQLSPETHLGTGVVTVSANQQFSNAMLSCQPFAGTQRFATEIDCNWLRISGRELTVSRQTRTLGYQEQAFGFSGGIQREVSDNFHVGTAISYESSRLRSKNLLKTEGDRFQAGMMFKRRQQATMASVGISFGYGDYDSTRYLDQLQPGLRATSSQDMHFLSLRGRLAHTVENNNWYVRPMIDAGWTYSHFDSFKERDAGGANLIVKKRRENYFNINPALEFGAELQNEPDILTRIYARVGGIRYLGGSNPEITATMEGTPIGVDPLKIEGDMDKSYLDLTLGINTLQRDQVGLRLEYSSQLSRNTRMHSGFVKLTIPF